MKHFNIPVFVPELACPNRCVFCNQNSISGCAHQPTAGEADTIIRTRLATIPAEGSHIEIAFFGGNFTGIDPALQREFLTVASHYLKRGEVHGIRLSTRPDYIDGEVLKLLKAYNVTTIELGAQSMDEEVLRLAGRGHTVADTERAAAMIRQEGFRLGLQMMTGLPGDTPAKSVYTARRIVELGAAETRIYPTLVIKNTPLESLWRSGHYTPQTLDEAISLTTVLLEIFDKAGVKVIRVGLHPGRELLEGGEMVAGPFHPNLRQLAERHSELRTQNSEPGTQNSLLKTHYSQLICADRRIPLPAKNALRNMGRTFFLNDQLTTYKSIAGHPDIFMCAFGNQVVMAPGGDDDLAALSEALTGAGYRIIAGTSVPGRAYPQSATYNAVVTGRHLIHNTKITDPAIRETFGDREVIHVNQGYTRCNLIALDDEAFITSDRGIQRALESRGLQVLYADPSPVILKGQKHGFFAGCCGIYGSNLVINGSLDYHHEGSAIQEFAESRGFKIISLWSGPLWDIGSLFFFENRAIKSES